jgi:hypothetical protein
MRGTLATNSPAKKTPVTTQSVGEKREATDALYLLSLFLMIGK